MTAEPPLFVAFAGSTILARGTLADAVLACKQRLTHGEDQRIALFDDATGRPLDIDFRGSEAEVLTRLAGHPMVAREPAGSEPAKPVAPRGPGRPKLGVASREISLLPRHWDWLAEQRGGASATLRRLVDNARKGSSTQDQARNAIDAAYRFMADMAGDQPGFEEASRALFAKDLDALALRIAAWPAGLREQLERFAARARPTEPTPAPSAPRS